MNFLVFIVFGAIAGWVASLVMKTNAKQGLLMDIVLGIIGAFLGGFIMNALGQPGVTGFDLYSFVVAVIGASIIIYAGRRFHHKRGAH